MGYEIGNGMVPVHMTITLPNLVTCGKCGANEKWNSIRDRVDWIRGLSATDTDR